MNVLRSNLVVHQKDTERAHHKGLHDKWGIGIITRTAETFLGSQTVLLSKSQVRLNNCALDRVIHLLTT